MPRLLDETARAFVTSRAVAHLATADPAGAPHVVPVCFVLAGDAIYFVIDAKPKRRGGLALKRMRNILENSRVAFLVDRYDDDWTQLAYLLIRGHAAVVSVPAERERALALLREKYPQYRTMDLQGAAHPVVRITPEHVHCWHA